MRSIKKGATSQSVYFDLLDSTSTTGGRKTGLVYNTSNLAAYYVRNQGSATAITLATLAAANSAFSSGGFKEVDATNMPGLYRLDAPDAAFATGADSVVITVKGATGMVQSSLEIQLVDNNSADVYSRLGAPAGASVSADIAAVKTDTAAIKTKTDSLTFTISGVLDANVVDWKGAAAPAMTGDAFARLGAPAGASVSADVAAVKTDTAAIKTKTDSLTFTVSGLIDSNVVDWKGSAAPAMTGDAYARLGAPTGASVSADIAAVKTDTAAIKTKTDSLTFTVSGVLDANVVDWKGAAAPAMTGDSYARLGAPAGASIAADIAALPTATTVNAVKAKTDNLPAAPAAVGDIPTAAAIRADLDANSTRLAHLDVDLSSRLASSSYTAPDNADIAAIKTKTDSLTFTVTGVLDANVVDWKGAAAPAMTGDAFARLGAPAGASVSADIAALPTATTVGAIKSKTDNLPAAPADESLIIAATNSLASSIAALPTTTTVNAIKAKTDNLPAAPSAVGDIPTAAAIRTELDSNSTKLVHLDADVSSRLAASSYAAPLDAAGTRSAVGLASANLDTQLATIAGYIDTEVGAIKAKTDLIPGTIDGQTFAQHVALQSAVLLGKASGLATTTARFRSLDDAKDRVVATVDADGNRSAVTLDAS